MPHEFVPMRDRNFAKRLRRDHTDVERKLWQALRGNRLNGLRFKRQEPMGPYIVDFVSHDAKVVVEVDGSQHGYSSRAAKDRIRDKWLGEHGYRVLRFWNTDIARNLQGVLTEMAEAVGSRTPLSQPSPARGEGLVPDAQDTAFPRAVPTDPSRQDEPRR